MKRIILIALLLFFAFPAHAWMSMMQVAGAGGAAAAYHCDSVADSDVLCEDVESVTDCGDDAANDQNCRNITWDSTETGGTVIFDAAHNGTLSCADKGTRAIQITKDNTGSTMAGFKKSISDVDHVYVQFYLNVITSPANAAEIYIFYLTDTATNQTVYLRLTGTATATAPTIRTVYHNGTGVTAGSAQALTTGTWYRIRVEWAKSTDTNGIVKFTVGDTVVTNVTNNGSTRQAGFYQWGNVFGNDTDVFTIQIDNIKIDDDAEPGACS